MYDIIIVGGGVAGFSAAMYAKRFEMNVIVITEFEGGTITQTHIVENWPGIPSTTGFELGSAIAEHAKGIGVEVIWAKAVKIEKTSTFSVTLDDGSVLEGKTVLLATGTKHRELGLESEQRLKNKGVSYCATCDGSFFKGKVVGIVGGSDSAVKESLLLTQYASKVYIIYRGEQVRPEPINMRRMKENPKIELVLKSNVVEVLGENSVTGVKLDTGVTLDLEGLFIEIGGIPQTELALPLGVNVNAKGEIITDKFSQTNIPGLFAAGDITDNPFKQAIVSSAEGAHAAGSAFEYVGKL